MEMISTPEVMIPTSTTLKFAAQNYLPTLMNPHSDSIANLNKVPGMGGFQKIRTSSRKKRKLRLFSLHQQICNFCAPVAAGEVGVSV